MGYQHLAIICISAVAIAVIIAAALTTTQQGRPTPRPAPPAGRVCGYAPVWDGNQLGVQYLPVYCTTRNVPANWGKP